MFYSTGPKSQLWQAVFLGNLFKSFHLPWVQFWNLTKYQVWRQFDQWTEWLGTFLTLLYQKKIFFQKDAAAVKN
jgi:hypothetical protein